MAESSDHLTTVESPPLVLEVYQDTDLSGFDPSIADRIPALWQAFVDCSRKGGVFDILGLDADRQTWEVELTFVSNESMRRINAQYRGKDEATDVLSFTLLADSPICSQLTALPVVQLGSIFISPEWAAQHAGDSPAARERFILERLVHGWLHLMGRHHDTMEDYEQVVAIQADVLNRID